MANYSNQAYNGIVCPFCYKSFGVRDVRFKFALNGAVVYISANPNDTKTLELLRKENLQAEVATENGIPVSMALRNKTSRGIVAKSAFRVCENEKCNSVLSAEAGKYSPDNGLFLLGLKSSGKTVYISSVINRLNGILAKEYGCHFQAYNREVSQRYQSNYYNILFEEKRLPDATIAPAQLPYEVKNPRTGNVVGITFSDIKGEIANSPNEIFTDEIIAMTVAHSNYFLVTIDIKDMEKNSVHMQWNQDIFNYMLKSATADPQRRSNQYLAVVITKSDELVNHDAGKKGSEIFSENSPIYRPVVYDDSFAKQRSITNQGLRDYVYTKYPQIAVSAEDAFDEGHVNYFAVSALGKPPVGDTCPEIAPIRVEEPVLWLLEKSGILSIGGGTSV